MKLTQANLERQISAALNENGVIWVPGQLQTTSSPGVGSYVETSDEVFDGEIFKGPLAGCGLRVLNIGSFAAMLRVPKEHKLPGVIGGCGVPLNPEIAEVLWNKAKSGQSSAN